MQFCIPQYPLLEHGKCMCLFSKLSQTFDLVVTWGPFAFAALWSVWDKQGSNKQWKGEPCTCLSHTGQNGWLQDVNALLTMRLLGFSLSLYFRVSEECTNLSLWPVLWFYHLSFLSFLYTYMYEHFLNTMLQVLLILFVWSPPKITTLMLKGASLITAKSYITFDFFFSGRLHQFPK